MWSDFWNYNSLYRYSLNWPFGFQSYSLLRHSWSSRYSMRARPLCSFWFCLHEWPWRHTPWISIRQSLSQSGAWGNPCKFSTSIEQSMVPAVGITISQHCLLTYFMIPRQFFVPSSSNLDRKLSGTLSLRNITGRTARMSFLLQGFLAFSSTKANPNLITLSPPMANSSPIFQSP